MNWTEPEFTLLENTFLFRGLPRVHLASIVSRNIFERREAKKGEVIYSPTHYQQALGIVLTGSISVSKEDSSRQSMIVSVLTPGQIFGAAALFHQTDHYVSTLTARSHCTMLFLTQGRLETLMNEYPLISFNYVCYLSGRIQFLSAKIDSLISGSSTRKLSQYLFEHMESSQDGPLVRLPCSMTELAERLHMGRASLYRGFDALEEEGIVQRQRKKVFVLQPKALQLRT